MIQVRQGTIDEVVATSLKIPELKNPYPKEEYEKRFRVDHLILVAEKENQIVGFKCGYDRDGDEKEFYSWMGGVLPAFRGQGVARLLLEEMEMWCRSKGIEILKFKTFNEHKAMLAFSLSHGFEIVGVLDSTKDKRKRIVLQKILTK